jgi:class 3 adenylate cyclase
MEYGGRIVKNTGDGMLVEFSSVLDAVRCAAEIQHGMIDREPEHTVFGDGIVGLGRLLPMSVFMSKG